MTDTTDSETSGVSGPTGARSVATAAPPPAEAARPVAMVLATAFGVSFAPLAAGGDSYRRASERARLGLALLFAAGLHAGGLALLLGASDAIHGGGGTEPGAVSISIVASAVLEALEADAEIALAASRSVAATDGRTAPIPPRPETEAAVAADAAPPAPPAPNAAANAADSQAEPPSMPDSTLAHGPDPIGLPDVAPPPPRPIPDAVELGLAAAPPPAELPPPAAPAAPSAASAPPIAAVGGATANTSVPGAEQARGAAGASPGIVQRYARQVVERLGRQIEREIDRADARREAGPAAGRNRAGTVRIGFTLAHSGAVAKVHVTRSSGNRQLDDAVLAALARIVFPPAPAGMTAAQLFYEVPIQFR